MMENLALFLFCMAGLDAVLLAVCLIADYVFPRIPPIQRYLDSLPDWEDEEDS